MKITNIMANSTSRLIFLSIVIIAILAGCIRDNPQKSWQRKAAEKAYAELGSVNDDAKRVAIRDYVKALLSLDKGGDPDRRFSQGRTLLMMAVLQGNKDIVERMLSLDVYADVNCVDDNGNTPLILACERADIDIAKMLVESGAQVNLQNNEGMTALMACARKGCKAIVVVLMSAGANIRMQDNNGDMVGNYAKSGGHADLISFIANFHSK